MTTVDAGDLAELGRFVLELEDWQRDTYIDSLELGDVEIVEAAIAAAELEGADWRETPATMAQHLTNTLPGAAVRLRLWPYVRLLGEKFRDAVEGRSIRQIWNMPPRYGKSLIASQWGPAWALDRNPAYRMLLVSYGDKLARENAGGCRDILRLYQGQLRAQLRQDRRAIGRFVTTAGGGILAGGIASALTGFGGHGAVFDDPFKDWQEAHSAARRNLVDNQFRAVVSSRLDFEDSWIIVPMTRWHEDDLSGRLIDRMQSETDGPQWDVVRIPELAEEPQPAHHQLIFRLADLLGRKPGEPIEPERFGLTSIKRKHIEAGSYLAAAMYQQRPAPEEGGEVKRGWFRLYDSPPDRYDQAIGSWDMKLKDKESGDYVVGQAWGRNGGGYWLFDQMRGQWNQATTENAIALMSVRDGITTHLVENTGNGPEVMAALRARHPGYRVSTEIGDLLGMTEDERVKVSKLRQRGMSGLIPVPAKGSKSVRMRAVSSYIEAGDVHIPNVHVRPWVGLYLDEMAAFPNGAHDDQVDATSQALARLAQGRATIKAAKGDVGKGPISTRGGGTMGVTSAPAPAAPTGPARASVRQRGRLIIPRGVPRSGR